MSIKSRARNEKRPNPRAKTLFPGQNKGLIPQKGIGLFRPEGSAPGGAFGGVRKEKRQMSKRIRNFLKESKRARKGLQ